VLCEIDFLLKNLADGFKPFYAGELLPK